MIKVENLVSGYGKKEVIKNVSFEISKSSFCALIGKNGSGKTTLLKTIAKIITPTSGSIYINNVNTANLPPAKLAVQVAYMPQITDTSTNFSVFDFVALGRHPHLNYLANFTVEDFKIINNALRLTDTEKFKNTPISRLSGGEVQRVALAQTIAQDTDILLLDEPSSHLDIGAQAEILELLRKLNCEGKTIVTTIHDLNAAAEYCNDIIFINNGALFSKGTPEAVFNYKDIETVYNTKVLVKTNPISQKPYIIPLSLKNLR